MSLVCDVLDDQADFPDIDPELWQLEAEEHHPADERHAYAFSIQLWERRPVAAE